MTAKDIYKKNSGLSLIEVMISISIIFITLSMSIWTVQYLIKNGKSSEVLLNLSNQRNSLMNMIQNPASWEATVFNDASFACVKAGTDCRGRGGNFDLYDTNGNIYYSQTSATAGFSKDGTVCNTFVAPGTAGNTNCVMRLAISWSPICPPVGESCANPLIQITGTFSINSPQLLRGMNVSSMNISLIQSARYCPSQVAVTYSVSNWGAGTVSSSTIPSQSFISDTTNPTAGAGVIDQIFPICRDIHIQFKDDNLGANNPDNTSQVCIYDSATANPALAVCLYEYVHFHNGTQNVFRLRQDAVAVYTDANSTVAADSYEFIIRNGVVQFLKNGVSIFLFSKPLTSSIRVLYKPAPQNYSPNGINNINTFTQN